MENKEEALRNLEEALKHTPNNLPLMRHIAQFAFDAGLNEKAISYYSQSLKLAPNDTGLKEGLAASYQEAGNSKTALVIVEELLEQGLKHGPLFLLHAKVLLSLKKPMEASSAYEKALISQPTLQDIAFEDQLNAFKAGSHSGSEEGEEWLEELEEQLKTPKINFEDVGGMESVKEEIRMKIIMPLKHPELFKAYGKKSGGGILLYGPPGCGKTHLARATAGEVQAGFLDVGLHEILDMWLGNSEKNLHELFEQARSYQPSVLFFDEVDALGASRSDMKGSASRNVINQFLAELDGVGADNEGVLVLAATNTPWHLDNAFRRPGRFDRMIFVPPPDLEGRKAILEVLMKDKPKEEGLQYDKIAQKTADFSGADLKALIEIAIEAKLYESLKAGKALDLTTKDLMQALKKVRPSTKEWFKTAKNYAMYANEGGIYDEILEYLKKK